jgi:hypothetical protein
MEETSVGDALASAYDRVWTLKAAGAAFRACEKQKLTLAESPTQDGTAPAKQLPKLQKDLQNNP